MDVTAADNRRFVATSLVATLVVAASLVFLNLDGYHNEFPILDSFDEEPPTINWTHGWPLRFMVRPSIYVPSSGIAAPTPASITGNDFAMSSRWPFDRIPVAYYYPVQLAVDVAFFLILCIGTAYGAHKLARNFKLRLRFGTKFLLATMTLIAIGLALHLPSWVPRQIPQFAAMAIIGIALLVMLYAAVDSLQTRIVAVK